jgi:acyl-CoA dehydrogenase
LSFLIDDDARMLRDSAGRLFAGMDSLRTLRRLRNAGDLVAIGRGAWAGMIELGLPGVFIPERLGGSGLGARAGIQVSEMMGRSLATGPFVASVAMGATAILAGANDMLIDRILPGVASGEIVLALATEETSRHRPDHVACVARPRGDEFRLSGRKVGVIDGNVADQFVVAARDDDGALSLFLVPAHADRLGLDARMAIDGRAIVTVTLDDVAASAADRIAGPDRAAVALDRAYDCGRLLLAAEMLGAAQEAFDRTIDYMKTRVQFGRKIGEFQALQHRAAILLGELEIGRSAVLKAAFLWDCDADAAADSVSLAKARLGDIARHVATEAVQLHGGIGVTDEFDIGLFLKRIRAASEHLGDSAFHTERYAQLHGI